MSGSTGLSNDGCKSGTWPPQPSQKGILDVRGKPGTGLTVRCFDDQGGVSSAITDLDGNLPGLPKYSSDLG
jgi:hypothetical protein